MDMRKSERQINKENKDILNYFQVGKKTMQIKFTTGVKQNLALS